MSARATPHEAWARQKSFRRKDERAGGAGHEKQAFTAEERHAQVHDDLEARLYRNFKESEANGTAERDAAMLMVERLPGVKRVALRSDKNHDTREFVRELRQMNITPHVAQNNTNRASAIDQRTTQHPG